MGRDGAGSRRQREMQTKHILRGRQESWHSVLVSYLKGFNIFYIRGLIQKSII